MSENLNYMQKTKQKQWPYILLLYVSFVWVALYPAISSIAGSFIFDYGNLFDLNSPNFSYIVFTILLNGFYYFIGFELIFWLYRVILSFKIYSFIVPADRLKVESRVYFIIRNIIYGLYVNLCFFHPYLGSYMNLVDIVVTLITVLFFVRRLYRTYSEPIVSHFVFRYFCYPIFIYEALAILFNVIGVV